MLETEYESVVSKKKKVESDLTAANDVIKHKDADMADLKKVFEVLRVVYLNCVILSNMLLLC